MMDKKRETLKNEKFSAKDFMANQTVVGKNWEQIKE